MLFRPLLGPRSSFPSTFPLVFHFLYEMVCTAAVTVLQGSCQRIALYKGRPDSLISIPDSPLVGPRPLLLLTTFHPFLRGVVFSLWLFVASCGTGWAPTPSCNLRPPFHVSLPTTKSLRRHSHYAHCQPLQVNLWQSILVASYLLIGIQHLLQSSPFWNNRCLPLRTVDMRALGVAN